MKNINPSIFAINDIEMEIEPEAMSVQKEDLVYSWRTLRTNSSTKIPSGHGQSLVQVKLVFTDDQIIALHRLIVELRHSPFCYIENIWLRQVLKPEWNVYQKMAFTLLGFDIRPYQGTTNAWIVNLELSWFNYIPYTHNWLYRRDWTTNFVEGSATDYNTYKFSIGWNIDANGNKISDRPNIIDVGGEQLAKAQLSYGDAFTAAKEGGLDLEEMEAFHFGQTFDLQPLPNNMARSEPVGEPKHSLIYKRYINFLQRDALMKNFGIDVEALVFNTLIEDAAEGDKPSSLYDILFRKYNIREGESDPEYEVVMGLHESFPPEILSSTNRALSNALSSLQSDLTNRILQHKEGVSFTFASYLAVQLPKETAEATRKIASKLMKEKHPTTYPHESSDLPWLYDDIHSPKFKLEIRRGLSEPEGFYSPIGKLADIDFATPPGWRAEGTNNDKRARWHQGFDINGPVAGAGDWGKPVYAAKDGTIKATVSTINSPKWTRIIKNDTSWEWTRIEDDSAEKKKIDLLLKDNAITVESVGLLLKLQEDWYYFLDNGSFSGLSLTIDHNGGNERSYYCHLSGIKTNPATGVPFKSGDTVKAGDQIGYVGNTGELSPSFVNKYIEKNPNLPALSIDAPMMSDKNKDKEIIWRKDAFKLSPHLHFAYWEREDFHSDTRKAPNQDNATISRSSMAGYVLVDIKPTVEAGMAKGYISKIEDNLQSVNAGLNQVVAQTAAYSAGSDKDRIAMIEALEAMYAQGYYYLTDYNDISNVWWKPWRLLVDSGDMGLTDAETIFANETAILTSCSGGFRHVVASIPILGHEFPTHQHLGSIEPYYTLEFHLLDDTGDLSTIGRNGSMLTAMRTMLQHNARAFRSIPDSWALSTNCFLTRLIGTSRIDDSQTREFSTLVTNTNGISTGTVQNQATVVLDEEIRRRTIISRASIETVEGNPGLSRLILDLEETHPYNQEVLKNETAVPSLDMNKARKEILNKLYNLDLINSGNRDILVKILIAKLSNANLTQPGEADYGKFSFQSAFDSTKNNASAYVLKAETSLLGSASNLGVPVSLLALEQNNNPQAISFIESLGNQSLILADQDLVLRKLLVDLGLEYKEVPTASDKYEPVVAIDINMLRLQSTTIDGHLVYDISEELKKSQSNQLLAELDLIKILGYYNLLINLMTTANMVLAEDDAMIEGELIGSSLPISVVKEALYDLPVDPSLLRLLGKYLVSVGSVSSDIISTSIGLPVSSEDQVRSELEANPNWLHINEPLKAQNKIIADKQQLVVDLGLDLGMSTAGGIGGLLLEAIPDTWDKIKFVAGTEYDILASGLTDGEIAEVESMYADQYREASLDIAKKISRGYVLNLPTISTGGFEFAKSVLGDSIVSGILNGATDDENFGVFQSLNTDIANTVLSCGHYRPWPLRFDYISFTSSELKNTSIQDSLIEKTLSEATISSGPSQSISQYINTSDDTGMSLTAPVPGNKNTMLKPLMLGGMELFVPFTLLRKVLGQSYYDSLAGIKKPGSAFVWNITENSEKEKLLNIKRLLSRMADECLKDVDMLKAFGLQSTSVLDNKKIKGSEAYTDLNLPSHPYYNSSMDTYPDFYMWNVYEDTGMVEDSRVAVKEAMGTIITRCYQSMNRLQTGQTFNSGQDKFKDSGSVIEPNIIDSPDFTVAFKAEGSDGQVSKRTMATPFYPHSTVTEAIKEWDKYLLDTQVSSKTTRSGAIQVSVKGLTSEEIASLAKMKPDIIRLSSDDRGWGQSSGMQYPSRISDEEYDALRAQVNKTTLMFGQQKGYAEKGSPATTIEDRLNGLPVRRDLEPSHTFDIEALKHLADLSVVDIYSQKRRLARAYPTFKLYFIEEDEQENRLLSYDDFYSYNGIKDITVTMSRKHPGDTAIVTLQNISGTLDGTKRDAVVDLDYFTKKLSGKKGDSPEVNNTTSDQPFGALVLRPGLNVQLRIGYSNDPDLLSVLLNGRVADVQWNQQGDTAQIMIQGFGTELVQILKGTDPNNEEVFWTTHQLLGSLLLEPELMHFGRWEFGRLFQIGEDKDSRFDFYDYEKNANGGNLTWGYKGMNFILNHPFMMGLLAVGIGSMGLLPGMGKFFSGAGRFGSRLSFVTKYLERFFGKGVAAYARADASIIEKELLNAISSTPSGRNGAFGALLSGTSKINSEVAAVLAQRRAWALLDKFGADAAKLGLTEAKLAELELEVVRKLGLSLDKVIASLPKGTQVGTVSKSGEIEIKALAEALTDLEGDISTGLLKGQWMLNPTATGGVEEILKGVGFKPFKEAASRYMTNSAKLFVGAGVLGTAAIPLDALWEEIYQATIEKYLRFFQATRCSIFITPQDDNLYPPHPKDYMMLDRSVSDRAISYMTYVVAGAATSDKALAETVSHYFGDKDPFDKRVHPKACRYRITNSYIWDVLHEMSLRHPGWVYGIRPYGTEFRYTLFFGVPSQRYWSKPADNQFVDRINKVARFLVGDINQAEFRSLYGDTIEGKTLEEIEETFLEEASSLAALNVQPATKALAGAPVGDTPSAVVVAAQLAVIRRNYYGGRALKEYIKGLDSRFIPFRKYHTISSEIDLVWNGIMGSENATYNAVDVTYVKEREEGDTFFNGVYEQERPAGSALFKSHAYIPASQLRVKPLEQYPNCRGYDMAARYGMGDLLNSMKEMYRGEIVVLGNARISPHDICILHDTYNSIVGPIEVEQIVHNFSHETGFITEIKPSALVLANETSSWPILEAMKIASLAVKNSHDHNLGITADSFGTLGKFSDWLTGFGPGNDTKTYQDSAERKMKELFQQDLQNDKDLMNILFGKNAPTEAAVKQINNVGSTVSQAAGVATAIVGGATMLSAGGMAFVAKKYGMLGNKWVAGSIAATGAVGAGIIATDYLIDPPALMSLLGGSILMLQCLKGDSMMLVPLMKNGAPIIAGLNYHDPALMWTTFLGDVGRYIDDIFGGTKDLYDLWSTYGQYAWRQIPTWSGSQQLANRNP